MGIRPRLFFLILFALFSVTAHADKRADLYYQQAIRLHGSASVEEVFALYTKAAELGNAAAQYNIAMMYSNGEAVNVDYQQALYWFNKSASQQFPPAQYRLGELYFFGMGGLPKDTKSAKRLFNAAAEHGDIDAQLNLAILLGTGHAPDMEKALYWLTQAHEGGHESAQHYLELLQANGNGGFTESQGDAYWKQQEAFWIEMAAEFGVREAREAIARPPGKGR